MSPESGFHARSHLRAHLSKYETKNAKAVAAIEYRIADSNGEVFPDQSPKKSAHNQNTTPSALEDSG